MSYAQSVVKSQHTEHCISLQKIDFWIPKEPGFLGVLFNAEVNLIHYVAKLTLWFEKQQKPELDSKLFAIYLHAYYIGISTTQVICQRTDLVTILLVSVTSCNRVKVTFAYPFLHLRFLKGSSVTIKSYEFSFCRKFKMVLSFFSSLLSLVRFNTRHVL